MIHLKRTNVIGYIEKSIFLFKGVKRMKPLLVLLILVFSGCTAVKFPKIVGKEIKNEKDIKDLCGNWRDSKQGIWEVLQSKRGYLPLKIVSHPTTKNKVYNATISIIEESTFILWIKNKESYIPYRLIPNEGDSLSFSILQPDENEIDKLMKQKDAQVKFDEDQILIAENHLQKLLKSKSFWSLKSSINIEKIKGE